MNKKKTEDKIEEFRRFDKMAENLDLNKATNVAKLIAFNNQLTREMYQQELKEKRENPSLTSKHKYEKDLNHIMLKAKKMKEIVVFLKGVDLTNPTMKSKTANNTRVTSPSIQKVKVTNEKPFDPRKIPNIKGKIEIKETISHQKSPLNENVRNANKLESLNRMHTITSIDFIKKSSPKTLIPITFEAQKTIQSLDKSVQSSKYLLESQSMLHNKTSPYLKYEKMGLKPSAQSIKSIPRNQSQFKPIETIEKQELLNRLMEAKNMMVKSMMKIIISASNNRNTNTMNMKNKNNTHELKTLTDIKDNINIVQQSIINDKVNSNNIQTIYENLDQIKQSSLKLIYNSNDINLKHNLLPPNVVDEEPILQEPYTHTPNENKQKRFLNNKSPSIVLNEYKEDQFVNRSYTKMPHNKTSLYNSYDTNLNLNNVIGTHSRMSQHMQKKEDFLKRNMPVYKKIKKKRRADKDRMTSMDKGEEKDFKEAEKLKENEMYKLLQSDGGGLDDKIFDYTSNMIEKYTYLLSHIETFDAFDEKDRRKKRRRVNQRVKYELASMFKHKISLCNNVMYSVDKPLRGYSTHKNNRSESNENMKNLNETIYILEHMPS